MEDIGRAWAGLACCKVARTSSPTPNSSKSDLSEPTTSSMIDLYTEGYTSSDNIKKESGIPKNNRKKIGKPLNNMTNNSINYSILTTILFDISCRREMVEAGS